LINQITTGNFWSTGIVKIDGKTNTIYFGRAGKIRAEEFLDFFPRLTAKKVLSFMTKKGPESPALDLII
jgi:hypothetical protein